MKRRADFSDSDLSAATRQRGLPRIEPPSIAPATARAEEIRGGKLAAALLPTAVLEAPPEIDLRVSNAAAQIAHELAAWGMCRCRCGLDPNLSAAAAAEAAALHAKGEMETRGFVRRGVRVPPDREQRADLCIMLSDDPEHRLHPTIPALLALDATVERFAHATVAQLGLLEEDERGPMGGGPNGERLCYSSRGDLMLAVYPGGGAFHRVHIDNQDGDGRTCDFGRVLVRLMQN